MIDTELKQIDLQELLDNLSDRAFMVKTGEAKALPLYADIHLIEKAIKDIKDEIKSQTIDEIGKYDKNDLPVFHGFVAGVSSRRTWKYNDPEIDRLKALQKQREGLAKEAYKLSQKGSVLHDENGEVIEPATFTESTFPKFEVVK